MFASDNASGAHPDVMRALSLANVGHAHAYGNDDWTRRATAVIRTHLGGQAEPFFVFNGTGANVTGLSAVMRPHEAIICATTAHINADECGAPERFTGGKLIDLPSEDGKLTPAQVEAAIAAAGVGVEHHSQPRVLSVTQATELGTVYRPEELHALADTAHAHGLLLHVDGARLSNAAAFLGCGLRDFVTDAGVDVLSLGGAKNGMLFGEAVVFLNPVHAEGFRFVRKNSAQLASKTRFISAQFEALFGGDLWLENARHANAMARLLAEQMSAVSGIDIVQPVEANEVFARVCPNLIKPLQDVADYYVWDEKTNIVRWVASWDTTHEDIDQFARAAVAFSRE